MSDFEVLRRLAAVTAMSEEEVEQARAARDFTDGSIWQLEGVTPRHSVPDLNDEQVRALTSDEALLKVIEFEVTSEAVYRKKYEKPIAPAGQSGITIGIGYDLGHNDQAGVRRDLAEQVLHDDIEVLIKACGIKGDAARQRLAEFRNVRVTWEAAREIYRRATVPRFARDVLRTFPNAVELKGHCFGALLSLVYNRGSSLEGDRRREMREIRDLMAKRNWALIPAQFRAMADLWKGQAGLAGVVKRREAEAILFERGLEFMQQPIVVAATAQESKLESLGGDGFAAIEGDGYRYQELEESGAVFESVNPSWQKVVWPPDEQAPDYRHISDRSLAGTIFEFGPRELELLIEMNSFQPSREDGRIVFALRGAQLVQSADKPLQMDRQENRTQLTLREGKPDHKSFRCVLGVYDIERGRMFGYTASTVPNPKAVASYVEGGDPSNMMLTGCYQFEVGWHQESRDEKKIPGTLVEHGRRKAVLRTKKDYVFDVTDSIENTQPGDNVHPGKSEGPFPFSSWGCLVLKGSVDPVKGGERAQIKHTGEWAAFRTALGLPERGTGGHGRRVDVVLLTGLDAVIAAGAATTHTPPPSEIARPQLQRLRQGSQGHRVKQLRRGLGMPEGDQFDAAVAAKLAERQRTTTGTADAIYAPATDVAMGFGAFAAVGPMASLEGLAGTSKDAKVERARLAFELGSHYESARGGRPTRDDSHLEGLGSTLVALGTQAVVATGHTLIFKAEQTLREYVCNRDAIGQHLDRDGLRQRVDDAARTSTRLLRNILVTILRQATFSFAPYEMLDRLVGFILDELVVPQTGTAGDQVLQRIDGGVEWLCGQWGQRIETVYGTPGATAAPPAPVASPAIPVIFASPAKGMAMSMNATGSVNASKDGVEASRLLGLVATAASGDNADPAAVRNYIHQLRNHLRTSGTSLSAAENHRFLDVLCDTRFMEQLSGVAGHDPYALIEEIEKKLRSEPHERPAAMRLLREFNEILSDARVKIQDDAVVRLLKALRSAKLFDELSQLADRFVTRDPKLVGLVSNWYAQGLIDSGRLVAGIEVLHAAADNGKQTPEQAADAEGILGRAHKQIYVNFVRSPSDAAALRDSLSDQLTRAINSYRKNYDQNQAVKTYYHGINYIALLKRAGRDRIAIDGTSDADQMARNMIAQLEPVAPGTKDPWLLASLGEAYLALGEHEKAAKYFGEYANHPFVDAFALNGTIRQLSEVWQLSATSTGAGAIVTGLKSALAAKENGFVSFNLAERRQLASAQSVQFQHFFETKVDGGKFQKLYDLQRIVQRGAAVVGIQQLMGNMAQTVGTGFLIKGTDLGAGLPPDKSYVLTNAHVLWDPKPGQGSEGNALRPEQAQVVFETLMYDGRSEPYKCSRVVWQSPSSLLDATLFELDRVAEGIKPLELAGADTPLSVQDDKNKNSGTRLAVVGHPEGGSLAVSVLGSLDEAKATLVDMGPQGNSESPVFLHYRTPTEPGNSGSPVFEIDTWKVVALHHAGYDKDKGRPKLGGKAGSNFANEGISIGSIRREVAASINPPATPKRRAWFS